MIRRRLSTFARRAPADRSGFGATRRSALRTVTRVSTTAAVILGGGPAVFACPVCFGAEESAMIDGTKSGILVLLAITLLVQGAFAGFFLYLRNRARRIAELELDTEWSELQKGASRAS